MKMTALANAYPLWNILGIALYMGARIWMRSASPPALWLGYSMVVLGVGCLVYGLSRMAVFKGYHHAWGILGLTGVLGLIVIALLPDRRAALR